MANYNHVGFIGRLTRDPEVRTFANGGKVAKFGFVVNDRRKNGQTGQWEDEPMFINVEVYNRGENGKAADNVEKYLKKGSAIFVEGKLKLDQWDDKTTGAKRSAHKIVADLIQFLDKKEDGADDGDSGGKASQSRSGGGERSQPRWDVLATDPGRGGDDEIPF